MAATTRVTLTVHTVFKGSVVASTAVVRLPGGETPNGDSADDNVWVLDRVYVVAR